MRKILFAAVRFKATRSEERLTSLEESTPLTGTLSEPPSFEVRRRLLGAPNAICSHSTTRGLTLAIL